ncbi:YitT family protein [Terribacillus saccharophilus]|uniref:YitT family protein n=1 Tax=Terribacillus saccharophilus TaxID=361277 RepID=UPI002989D7B1|nr:YitT family protein [Terribacillus saccharophilus]MCM3224658.1 YitT family protein [Terribacillus saccharophilus]MEC0283446.1 YitT family protein [Terribacillus saccharophilus]MEC0290402.1 YitT family protein [Terribacillus saccharophilus]
MFRLRIKNILFILLGAAIFSFGIVHFNIANKLGEGGFTGITLILLFEFDWDPAIMNLVLNIPLFLIGWKFLGRTTFVYTIIGTVAVSLFLRLFQTYSIAINLGDDLLIASLLAGVFIGVGLGIIFRFGGTTGGVDIIARLANKYAGWTMGRTMFLFDAVVIITSVLTYLDLIRGMYTLVAVFVGARVIDFIQEGAYSARGATIISSQSADIANQILKQMDRGVTVLDGRGSFTGEKRDVLYCVVARNEIVRLKAIITAVDPHAFVALSEVHDVMGEGFTLDENKKPYHTD